MKVIPNPFALLLVGFLLGLGSGLLICALAC